MTTTNGTDQKQWTVVIADDHAITRAGVRLMVESLEGVSVLGEAGSGAEALELCERLHPDVVLMDIEMPEMDGVETTKRLKAEQPEIAVLVLTVHDDEDAVFEAIRAGASGYLTKTANLDELKEAFRAIQGGGAYLTPSSADKAMRSLSRRAAHAHRAARAMETTPREREILALLAEGHSARRMARALGITERTVTTHVGHIYRRLGVTNRVEAVREAMRLGLVNTPAPSD